MHPSQALFQDQVLPIFIPVCDHYAGSEKLMRKSLALQNEMGPVFDITLDCEDGATIGHEEEQIKLIANVINSSENRFNRVGVRVHEIESEFFKSDIVNLINFAKNKIAYIVIPKIIGFSQISEAIKWINTICLGSNIKPIPIHVLIETQQAVLEVNQIASHSQIECLSFGIMDYVSSHLGVIPSSAMHSPKQFSHPLVMRAKIDIAAACHLHGKTASHNVTTEFKDLNTIKNDARLALEECGYTRMWSIHPKQIQPIIDAMLPSQDEISQATLILKKASNHQWGPIEFEGRLHDRASFRYYWTILQKAKLFGLSLNEDALLFI